MTTFPKPHYFAWVDAGEAFNPAVHNRYDENVIKAEVEQLEGDFAIMTLVVKNPKIGLLAPARKVWGWWSNQDGSSVVPLFFGRLMGIPSDINKELVTLQFVARPADFVALKIAKAETLKVRPYYDPIFINQANVDDPDVVLEARPALWSIDRVTHAVDISDILVGEDGEEEFNPGDVPYDSVQIRFGEVPLRAVAVDATANWTQQFSGVLPMLGSVGASRGGLAGPPLAIETYTGASLISDWPKTGASLGGGWKVQVGSAYDTHDVERTANVNMSYTYNNPAKTHNHGDTMSQSSSSSMPLMRGPFLSHLLILKAQGGILDPFSDPPTNQPASSEVSYLFVPLWRVVLNLSLAYEAARPRKEHVRFTLATNSQSIVTMPGEAEALTIAIDSVDIGLPVAGGDPPIGDLKRSSYFPTDRGLQSLEYLVNLARARLISRSRSVEITFICSFERAIALSMRKNARLHDNRLPGGVAVGKIIGYKFGIDGTSGGKQGSVTIGCAIGYGQAVAGADGDPLYCELGYVEPGYQAYENTIVVLPAGDVSYTVPVDAVTDDGLRFPVSSRQVVLIAGFIGTIEDQENAIQGSFLNEDIVATAKPKTVDEQNAFAQAQASTTSEVLKRTPIRYHLELKPINQGPFEFAFDIETSQLEIPKQIDLEAAA